MSKSIDEIKSDYDWREAFSIAKNCPYSREDIEEVIATDDGYNDGDSWIGVFKMKDGMYLYITAWCDYTGWDCQAGGDAYTASNLESLFRNHVPQRDADRLKYAHNGKKIESGV